MRWNKRLGAVLICASASAFIGLASVQAYESQNSFVYKKKYVMGTIFEIATYAETPAQGSNGIDQAFREIVRLDDLMSDYKDESALSRLNRSVHLQPESVPDDLYRVIDESLYYSRLSDGKFDITVRPLVNLWKAANRGGRAPSLIDQEKLRACVGYQTVELLPPNRIKLRSSCLQIDLGAIGKGYALDRAAVVLRSCGISRALLNAGGSTILAMGAPPGQAAWPVDLRDPSNSLHPQVRLRDNSISTSEQTPPSLLSKEVTGHIIDPANGLPLKTDFAVSVIAKTATASDALSTTLLLLGPEKGQELVKIVPDMAAIWISADGRSEMASSGPQILLPNAHQGLTRSFTARPNDIH